MISLALIPELSRFFPSLHPGYLAGSLAVLAMAGPLLHAYLPRHQMLVDERVKNQVLTATEARRQVTFLRAATPIAILLGTLELVGMLCDLPRLG
jgi:hypothetical protein